MNFVLALTIGLLAFLFVDTLEERSSSPGRRLPRSRAM